MDALIKGSHAPKVTAVCSRCGSSFERSAVHPYIVECPDCRGADRAARDLKRKTDARLRCKACRAMVSAARPLGMHSCGGHGCDRQWWSLGSGWWRDTGSNEVFRLGEYRGTLNESTFDDVFRGVRDDLPNT
jgi:hypothetical protein